MYGFFPKIIYVFQIAKKTVVRRSKKLSRRVGQSLETVFYRAVAIRSSEAVEAMPHEVPRQSLFKVLRSASLVVFVPTLIATIYFYFFAADQYASEFKFAVRGLERPSSDPLSSMGANAGALNLLNDAFVVTEFINSPQIVLEVDRAINLHKIYSTSQADLLTRLPQNSSAEDLSEYWKGMVTARFDMVTGIGTVLVKAFTPQDAQLVAQTIIKSADHMFTKMTERARRDSVKFAEEEEQRARQHVYTLRMALHNFRDKERVWDPNRTAQANSDFLNKLREELTRMQTQLATLTRSLSPNSPQVQVLKKNILSTEEQIEKLSSNKFPSDSSSPALMSQYESLTIDLQLADKAYAAALESLQRARIHADRKTTYLALFVEPHLAQTALFPQRGRQILIIALVMSVMWMLGLLVIASIRDHLL